MKKCVIYFLSTLWLQPLFGQQVYSDFTETIRHLYHATDEGERNQLWVDITSSANIPLIAEDSVAFLYRGDARSVTWMGDFNGWGNSKTFKNKGIRIPQTDIWVLKASIPPDARLDYKILLNDNHYILDPLNPSSQWSGVGGGSLNSELRMTRWREDSLTNHALPHATHGKVLKDIVFKSHELGYQVTYNVYTPHGYDEELTYPVLYVTDGYEYMHDRMGNMITVLDNLIHLGTIQPVVAVFIDHRDPINRSANRRMLELSMNDRYLNFVTQELMAEIDNLFSVAREPSKRAIIGTSQGGLSAAWFAVARPDLFGMAGIQSPAFWFKPDIYTLYDQAETLPLKVFMSTGLIHDAEEGARKMKTILDKRNCANEFKTVNQGHSWGNWRDQLDDMLLYLFPAGT